MRHQEFVRSWLLQFAIMSLAMVWLGSCADQPKSPEPTNPGLSPSSNSGPVVNPRLLTLLATTGAIVTDSGCLTNTLAANDDGSTGAVTLPFTANFYGSSRTSFYVNNNGNVTFDNSMRTYTPFTVTATVPPMIAVFFGDVDTRGSGSGQVTYGNITFNGRPAICVNWVNVGYFASHADKLNSFQLVLVDRSDIGAAGDFDIVLNHAQIQWETGDASGGSSGFGGSSASVGYSDGSGNAEHFYSFPGSLVNGALLDSNATTGLIHGTHNSSVLGRYIFPVRSGQTSPDAGGCQCDGTGPDGPVTAFCGESACGVDHIIYACGGSGWTATGQACLVSDAAPPSEAGSCECTGTGPSGPVTVSCGQSACGVNNFTYSCSSEGWSATGQPCDVLADAGVCQCSGTGPGGIPVTVNCGQSACGSNYVTYACSAAGWSSTDQACDTADAGSCACTGTGPGGVPVTVDCGQSACGENYFTYACSAAGWSYTGQACVAPDASVPPAPDAGACQCTGTGPGGFAVTVSCGQSACGSNFLTYGCSGPETWSYVGEACACSCDGTGPGGVPVTVYCGQSACGSDYLTHSCSPSGWSAPGASCQPGTLDPTFDLDGVATAAIGPTGTEDVAYAVAIQPDGKVVVAGRSGGDFAVVRFNADGSLDTTFGSNGHVTTSVSSGTASPPWASEARGVVIQPDGKIVVAGSSGGSSTDFGVVRYNADGSLDTTFSGDGIVITRVGLSGGPAYAVALQSDGKIVVGGGYWDFELVRYNTDGSLDTTFDGDGQVVTDFGSINDVVYALALQSDGKIVAAGASEAGDSEHDFALARYNSNGSLDASFGGNGKLTTSIAEAPAISDDVAYAVALQPDGRIVAAGGPNNFVLVRYNANGSLDTGFGGTGKVITSMSPIGNTSGAYGVALLPGGKIVAVGQAANYTDPWWHHDFAIARYLSDGSLDLTFDGDGKFTTMVAPGGQVDMARAVAVQPNGRVVAAGYADMGPPDALDYDFAVVRF